MYDQNVRTNFSIMSVGTNVREQTKQNHNSYFGYPDI